MGEVDKKQIKSKKRVQDFGEVYTNDREINAMLDLVKDESYDITSTFFEPACGNGNFLIKILERKLYSVAYRYSNNRNLFEIYSLVAFSSIYGIDIQEDNIEESKKRLLNWYCEMYYYYFRVYPSKTHLDKICFVLNCNILCGNSLTYQMNNGNELLISEWMLLPDYRFKRRQFRLQDMIECDTPKPINKAKYYDWYYAQLCAQ